jgi:hypothetical protein
MKRDMELIREILQFAENLSAGQTSGVATDKHSAQEIAEHIALMKEAGLIDAVIRCDQKGCPAAAIIGRLTWDGHEFLAKAKNDTIWKKVLQQAEEKGMSTSMSVINGLLEAAAKKYMGLE